MREYGVVVLAGGASTRLGSPKHLLELEGEPLVRRVVRRLTGAKSIVVSTSEKTHDEVAGVLSGLGVEVVVDSAVGTGPLGGLASGLAAQGCEWVGVCACDMPSVSLELFDRLFSLRREMDAVIPVSPSGQRQTLHALYKRESVLSACESKLAGGGGSVLDALEGLSVSFVPVEDESCFFNINTREELGRV